MKERETRVTGAIRRALSAALAAVAVLFFLPVLMLPVERAEGTGGPVAQGQTQREAPSPAAEPKQTGVRDRERTVRLLREDGSIEEMTMADYLWGVTAAEMPAGFEPEALKAQVCAARTYTVICQERGEGKHPGAHICGESTCCQAYVERETALARWGLEAGKYAEKLDQAVAQTDGLGVLYEGRPIQALFFSSASGKTVDAVEVWGNAVDYLKSVDSPEGEEVPNYHSRTVLPAQQVRQMILDAYPGAQLSGSPDSWFGPAQRGEGGTVRTMEVGGLTLTGGQLRSLFALRSAACTVSWDGEDFIFDVTGYGHGVGMSQYGANALAREGKSFRDILTWYYTGTTVEPLWK